MINLKSLSRRLALTILLFTTGHAYAVNEPDYLGYPVDSTVRILINWQSFLDQGIPATWQTPVQDMVINAYTRWMHVAGFRLLPRFWGYTTSTSPAAGEIIIMMNESHVDRLASRFGQPALIVFHRKNGTTNTDWPWSPYRANVGEFDMQTVLMHELGHAFGLEHNTNGIDRSVMGSYDFRGRFGPYVEDIEDLRVQYGTKTDRRFAVKVSTTAGLSWSDATSNLGSLGVTTSMDPTASRDAARTILFYTHHNKHPAWIHGDVYANNFSGSQWWVFGGLRSAYGTSGHGYDNEYMMAWVDDTDAHNVKVTFSSDGGNSFMWSNPPSGSQSYGTPSVHKVADNTWVLAYSKFNKTDENANGKIAARISTNDGASWSSEIFLNDFYRAASGVSVSSNGPGEIRIGFAWDNRTTGSNLLKRTIRAHVAAGSLIYDDMMYENEGTRTQPVMTRNSSSYLQAWREMNFATSINTRSSASIDTTWGSYVRAVESAPITPAVAAYRNWYYEYLFYTNY